MDPQVAAAIIAASVSALTLIGTLAAQYFARRATHRDLEHTFEQQAKQLDKTLAEQREQLNETLREQRARTFNERFAVAAEQLGSDKPSAVQLAGIYAMAGLADDWEQNRQTCVDVLCAYLRMPYKAKVKQSASEAERLAFLGNREVRHSAIRVISDRLRDSASVSWRYLNFDFTGAVFDGGDFSDTDFLGNTVSFSGAQFVGGRTIFRNTSFSGNSVRFDHARFCGGETIFAGAKFTGRWITFHRAEFNEGQVTFNDADFSSPHMDFNGAKFIAGSVYFTGISVRSSIGFIGTEFSGGKIYFGGGPPNYGVIKHVDEVIHFAGIKLIDGALAFHQTKFSGGEINFQFAEFLGGRMDFVAAQFTGTLILFADACFSGSTVTFSHAHFSGGSVDFGHVKDWSCPPKFEWQGAPPKEVVLPSQQIR
jgi:hypothetical protein